MTPPKTKTFAGRQFYSRQIDVGRVLGTSARMVHEYVRTGRLPFYTLPSGQKIYAVEDVEAFMIPTLGVANGSR